MEVIQNPQLVLIEGIPGSGKTSLSSALNAELQLRDETAVWYAEELANHPVIDRCTMREPKNIHFGNTCIQRWRVFMSDLEQQQQWVILDAHPFQNTIRFMLEHDLPGWVLKKYITDLSPILNRYRSSIIYLYHPDPEVFLNSAFEARKPKVAEKITEYSEKTPFARARGLFGRDALVALYSEYQQLSMDFLKHLKIPLLMLNSSEMRESAIHQEAQRWLNQKS